MPINVLIIGGSGYIGRFLVEELTRASCRVAVISRQRHEWLEGFGVHTIVGDRNDLMRMRRDIQGFRPDVVVDLILSSGRQARDLVSATDQLAGRLVVASSMDVYRASAVLHEMDRGDLEPVPLREDSRLRPAGPMYPSEQLAPLLSVFGWLDDEYDKVAVEQELPEAKVPVVVLRLPMMYGPRDPIRRLQQLVRRMDDQRPAIIVQEDVANWRTARSYVGDAAHAIALATLATGAPSRVYNVAERDGLSETEWIQCVGEAVGWRGDVLALPRDQVPVHLQAAGRFEQHWTADSERIRRELGYSELRPRAAALTTAVEWERAQSRAESSDMTESYRAEDAAIEEAKRKRR